MTTDLLAGPGATESAPTTTCTLDLTGMTCASCVRRVEKVLTKLDGVALAQVNLATEAASVVYDPARVTGSDLTAAVAGAGYGATVRREAAETGTAASP